MLQTRMNPITFSIKLTATAVTFSFSLSDIFKKWRPWKRLLSAFKRNNSIMIHTLACCYVVCKTRCENPLVMIIRNLRGYIYITLISNLIFYEQKEGGRCQTSKQFLTLLVFFGIRKVMFR